MNVTDDVPSPAPTEVEGSPGFIADFDLEGDNYQVIFKKVRLGVFAKNSLKPLTDDGYSIDFFGPQEMELTGLGKAHQVYTKMLLIVKKFVETHNPDGITASPYIDRMLPVYERFFKRYGQDFVRTDQDTYFSRRFVAGLNPELQQAVAISAEQAAGEDYTSSIRSQASVERQTQQRLKNAQGKIVMAQIGNETQPVYLSGVNKRTNMGEVRDSQDRQMSTLLTSISPVNWLASVRFRSVIQRLQGMFGAAIWT